MNSILYKKNVLITGGSGSIGKALASRAIADGAKTIRIFSNDENGLYEMELNLKKNKNLEFVIGDIRNTETVHSIVKKIDIIFHAAALKHVDRCELNPLETTSVNVIGTNNILQAAISENVERVICISTDKAVNPIGVMGATKLLSEKLVASEAFHKKSQTILASVRFGNVFHSRGSILPRIESQIKNGGPVTLTDEKMLRYFMTIENAVDLILNATKMSKGGEIFILKMPLLRLKDLFETMIDIIAPKYGFTSKQIKIKKTGIRSGEKLTEFLLTKFEMEHALETKEFFIIPPFSADVKNNYHGAKKVKDTRKYFENLQPLTSTQILKLLKSVYSIK